MLTNKKLIIFDLDGVVYKDNNLINEAKYFIEYLNSINISYCFLTNNSSYNITHYSDKLNNFGIITKEENIITPLKLVHHYLSQTLYKKVFVMGSNSLKSHIYKSFEKDDSNPDCIVIGMNNEITLKEISDVINLSNNNIPIIATNPDALIPRTSGYDLECGAIISIIEKFSSNQIHTLGKPNGLAYKFILDKFKLNESDVLMIGDTYDTDIIGATNIGIDSVWVATGNKLPKNIDASNFIRVSNLKELLPFFKDEK